MCFAVILRLPIYVWTCTKSHDGIAVDVNFVESSGLTPSGYFDLEVVGAAATCNELQHLVKRSFSKVATLSVSSVFLLAS